MQPAKTNRLRMLLLTGVSLSVSVVALFLFWPASASSPPASSPPASAPRTSAEPLLITEGLARAPLALPQAQGDGGTGAPAADSACRDCHEESSAALAFASGETLSVAVDLQAVAQSVHGGELNCTSCHAPASYQYPHPAVEVDTLREYEIARSLSCERCHQQPHITSHPGREAQNPVVCTDCHGAHDVHAAEQWFEGEGLAVCADCHAQRDVALTATDRLLHVVQNDLFAQRPDNDYCLACHGIWLDRVGGFFGHTSGFSGVF